jgi:hypothetical protein
LTPLLPFSSPGYLMNRGNHFFQTAITFFLFLCILFIPFPFHWIHFQPFITGVIFGKLIGIIAASFFGIYLKNIGVYSDSTSMYVLALLLFILSVIISFLLMNFSRWQKYRVKVFSSFYLLFCYYLIVILLKYGLDKIFKSQFYLPEPNILYTQLGQVDKDLLYWTSMGTSRLYNIFTGLVEVFAALLLIFKKTRVAGLLLASASLTQVVAVNFSFDISVKLYSLFLLCLSMYLLAPYSRRLYYSLFTQKEIPGMLHGEGIALTRNLFVPVFIKSFIALFIFFESLYPYIRSGNFNDDNAKRPYLHGAYEVKQVIAANTILTEDNYPVKRFFIHRSGYIIFQNQKDEMQDFSLSYDTVAHFLVVKDYQLRQAILKYEYKAADSILALQYFNNGREYQLFGKAQDWRKLPVLQKSFHWTVDGGE